MTIDEAIEKFKFIANSDTPCPRFCMLPCDKCVDESKQLAECLEELKSYRASAFSEYMTQKMLKEEYNKAIDDLLEDANEMAIEVDVDTYTMKAIGIGLLENIAEQLKAGVRNGTDSQQ